MEAIQRGEENGGQAIFRNLFTFGFQSVREIVNAALKSMQFFGFTNTSFN